jgi:hypothetical protein
MKEVEVGDERIGQMRIFALQCPKCQNKMGVEPLDTQQYGGKTCDKCGAAFSFSNADLEVIEALVHATDSFV